MQPTLTQTRNKNRADFLHTFFPTPEGYQIIEVNGYYLINQWNATNNEWNVAIYPPESYKRMNDYKVHVIKNHTLPTPKATTGGAG